MRPAARTVSVLSVVFLGLTSYLPAAAEEGRTFDARIGRDVLNYPPDPQVRFEHIRLDLRFDDLASRSFLCTETIRFRTLQRPLRELTLDAVNLNITGVADLNGRTLPFRTDDEHLTITWSPELSIDAPAGVEITYECRKPKLGMTFALPDEAYNDRPLLIHTQGEPEYNRHWFVCHDFPNARSTSEVLVTIPGKYVAVSNGRLVERKELDGGRVQYHYLQEQPHPSYLIALVVGDLAVVRDEWRGKPVEYYVPPAQKDLARATLGKTPQMMDLYSKLLGVEYPYPKYAQVVCQTFRAGGMENTSMTTMHDNLVLDERAALDTDREYLISHELSHQWFGDMVTCRSWPHIWLNEGFATFLGEVWFEHSRSPDEYAYWFYRSMKEAVAGDVAEGSGLICAEYEEPSELFRRRGNYPYSKGGWVVHMLRCELGDDIFWASVREFLKRHAWKSAETDDLRRIMEEFSGRSLERFFNQWLHRPGLPSIAVKYEWQDGVARVMLQQTQKITREAPAFASDVDVWLVAAKGKMDKRVLKMAESAATLTAPLPQEPLQVVVDPRGAVLADWDLQQPAKMLVQQALAGPTMFARIAAVEALAEKGRDDARGALKTILIDESAHWGLRTVAAESLAAMKSPDARDILLGALAEGHAIQHHKVRRAAVTALTDYHSPQVTATLLRFARSDPTYGVQAAALDALGEARPTPEIVQTLLEMSKVSSYGELIRQAAVRSLGRLSEPQGLQPALALAAYGQPYQARPSGVFTLGQLGRIEALRPQIRPVLLDLLTDEQDRTAKAAIEALSRMGDEEALPGLHRFAESSAPASLRRAATDAVAKITARNGESAETKDLRERIEQLEKQREVYEKRLSALEAGATTRPASVPAR